MDRSYASTRWKAMGYDNRPSGSRRAWGRTLRPCAHTVAPEAGFTLVELLLALFLFALIASVIFASFAAVASGVEKGRQSMELYRVGRVALLRMAQEVGAAMPPPLLTGASRASSSATGLRGQKGSGGSALPHDRIDFLTIPYRRYSDKVPGYEICKVAYYVADNAQGQAAL